MTDLLHDLARAPLPGLVARAGTAVAQRQRRAAEAHGLSTTALEVLGVLADPAVVPADGPGPSHRELAAHLRVAPATLTPALDALEADGAVRRARDPADRRVVRITITPAGRARRAEAFPQVQAEAGARLPQPSPAEEAVVRAYLTAVLAAVAQDG